jgi:hypothetical protein
MHPIAKDFALCCIRPDENARFHTGKTDIFGDNIIRAHPWFQDLDWDAVEAKSFVPEWQPLATLDGKMDLRCTSFPKNSPHKRISRCSVPPRYASDVEDAPFAAEYVTSGAAVAGSKKDSFIDF